MSLFKLSNEIFDIGLNAKELSVYAYLCSLPSLQDTLDCKSIIRVKQSTIALKCGIKSAPTVAKVLIALENKSLVERFERSTKANHHKGTYIYSVKKLQTNKGYFFVERRALEKLNAKQIMVYLFLCKSYSISINDSWNSYNDISSQLNMKRETIISIINELVKLKCIVRIRRKSKENRRVYVDNHYQIIFYITGSFRRRKRKSNKKERLCATIERSKVHIEPSNHYYNITFKQVCQGLYVNRGSPDF